MLLQLRGRLHAGRGDGASREMVSFTVKTRRAILNAPAEGSQPHVLSQCVGGRLRISGHGLGHPGDSPKTWDGKKRRRSREKEESQAWVRRAPPGTAVRSVL